MKEHLKGFGIGIIVAGLTVFVIYEWKSYVTRQAAIQNATLQGKHQLKRLAEITGSDKGKDSDYFLFADTANADAGKGPEISFAWKMNDGTYQFTSLPLEKIRLRIDNRDSIPTVEFHSGFGPVVGDGKHVPEPNFLIHNCMDYAIITVR